MDKAGSMVHETVVAQIAIVIRPPDGLIWVNKLETYRQIACFKEFVAVPSRRKK
jgi:hypothetical protein